MTKLVDLLDQLKYRRTFGYMDDFDYFVAGERWNSAETGTGSAAVGATVGGILALTPSTGSPAANDAMYLDRHRVRLSNSCRTSRSCSRRRCNSPKPTRTKPTSSSACPTPAMPTTSLRNSNAGPRDVRTTA